ncbi:hypothetical protein K432DRAFT_278362, partial [Lepidopterella palustris CBS 459.81]
AAALAQTNPFTAIAARSASPIHFQSLTAAGEKFWLAGPATSSYCPSDIVPNCPAGDETVFVGGDDSLFLDVEVPAGQQVYIGPDGAMAFTQAHSATLPEGAITTGWVRSEGPSFGYLSWTNGLIACPVEGKGYQIFGNVAGVEFPDGCLGFDTLTENSTHIGAWEY